MAKVLAVGSDQFDDVVMESSNPVLVDFFATWCGPCKMLSPIVEQIADEMGDSVTVCKVDVDQARDIAMEYQIASVPTLMLFQNGAAVETLIGVRPKDEIIAVIEQYK